MDINSLFFSKRNIEKLSNKLVNNLHLKTDSRTIANCRVFVESQMKEILKKYGKQKPRSLSIPEFVDKLSEKSLEDCIKMYKNRTKEKKYSPQDVGSYQMDRDADIHRGQQKGILRRPQHTSGIKNNSEYPGVIDSMQGGGSNFAPLSVISGTGMYTTADGRMGSAEEWHKPISESSMYSGGKGNSDELQRRVLQRQQEYDQKQNFAGGNMESMGAGNFAGYDMGMGDTMNMGMGMGMGMDDTMGMNNNAGNAQLMYNPNPFGKNKPPDINFAMDGGDTRGSAMRQREEHQKMQDMMGQMGGMGNNMSMDYMGMNDPTMGMGMGMGMGMNITDYDSMMNNPMMNNPMMNNPMANNPMANNPMASNPMMGNPMASNPMMGNLMMGNPMASNPMASNPMMGNQMMGNQMMSNPMASNPMMGNPMMNSISNQTYNNRAVNHMEQSQDKINDQDFRSRMNQMQQDRTQLESNVNYNKKNFNPMISPNIGSQQYQQMLNTNQNFIKGREGGTPDFQNMKSEDIQKYIDNMKNSVIQNHGIDLKKLRTMSADKLKEIKNKLIEEMNLDKNNTETEDIENSKAVGKEQKISIMEPNEKYIEKQQNSEQNKEEILNMILKLKQSTQEKEKKLDNMIKGYDVEQTIEKKINKKNIIVEDNSEIRSDESDFDIYGEEEKTITINFNCEDTSEPEYYNNYVIPLPQNIKDISLRSLEICNLKLPQDTNIIKDSNKFVFTMDNKETEIELDDGEYTIDEIIESIQSGFDQFELRMKISVENNKIIIENLKKKSFEMYNEEYSLLKYLGFTKEKYVGKYLYESEISHSLFDNIYMYIYCGLNGKQERLFDNSFAEINIKKIKKNYKKELNRTVNGNFECLVIKFKNRITDENDDEDDEYNLYNFMRNPHQFILKIKYVMYGNSSKRIVI